MLGVPALAVYILSSDRYRPTVNKPTNVDTLILSCNDMKPSTLNYMHIQTPYAHAIISIATKTDKLGLKKSP